jgi:hypothetical protein
MPDARALGMLAQSDLGEDIFEFKDTAAARKAKEQYENTRLDWMFCNRRIMHKWLGRLNLVGRNQ